MKLGFKIILVIALFGACNPTPMQTGTLQWVYLEFDQLTDDGSTSCYYYGQMPLSILRQIEAGSGADLLFKLSKVRYINPNDSVVEYKEGNSTGDLYFRTSDIQHIEVLEDDPLGETF